MPVLSDPLLAPSREPAVTVTGVTRTIEHHRVRTVILEDVTFAVPATCLFAITGPSGSGKSTLLNLLAGIDRPTSGQILVAGTNVSAMSEDRLARWRGRHVGVVFQFFQLIPTLTALENVLLALELGGGAGVPRRHWRQRAQRCLDLVRVGEFARRLPSELSGGQQQRVAIARALANDPDVLIADEPTGNLDSQTAEAVFDTLAGLTMHGKTVVYVTHDPALAARADARVALLDGRIIGRERAHTAVTAEQGGAL